MNVAVKRLGGTKVRIDVLAARKQFHAGTLSAEDCKTVERMLPGLLGEWKKDAVEKSQTERATTQNEAKP